MFISGVFVLINSWIVICLFFDQQIGYVEGRKIGKPYDNGLCVREQFQCFNGECINRTQHCNSVYNCHDKSDELYCSMSHWDFEKGCPESNYPIVKCQISRRCIPKVWKCDDVEDCLDGSDEENCPNVVESVDGIFEAQKSAMKWLLNRRLNLQTSNKWGIQLPRIVVAMHLADDTLFSRESRNRDELTYELSIQILTALLRKDIEPISLTNLALYVHATLVACLDPHNLWGVNLVAMLRQRVDAQANYTNPFALLALCNAQDTMTSKDVDKLIVLSNSFHRPLMTDTKALVLMTLRCISLKSNFLLEPCLMQDMAIELTRHQNHNGRIETLHTTALIIQALFASEEEDNDKWDMEEAVKYLVKIQSPDGSFGNLINTYYVLPVLKYKSLLNVSSEHCMNQDDKENEISDRPSSFSPEVSTVVDLQKNQVGVKIYVTYTLWLGEEMDIIRTLELRTSANSTFFDVMTMAAKADYNYRFSYTTVQSKPYVYAVSGMQDEPDSEKYWFLYKLSRGEKIVKIINSSPVDVIPKDKDEFIMCYRSAE